MTLPLTPEEESLVRLSEGYRCVELRGLSGGRTCWGFVLLRSSSSGAYLYCPRCTNSINFALVTDSPPSESLASALRWKFRKMSYNFIRRVLEEGRRA